MRSLFFSTDSRIKGGMDLLRQLKRKQDVQKRTSCMHCREILADASILCFCFHNVKCHQRLRSLITLKTLHKKKKLCSRQVQVNNAACCSAENKENTKKNGIMVKIRAKLQRSSGGTTTCLSICAGFSLI